MNLCNLFIQRGSGKSNEAMKTIKEVNASQQGDLTYEKLKMYKGFEDITEAEAQKEIEIIKRLAKILYSYMQEQEKK